jgi:hypothetical protein
MKTKSLKMTINRIFIVAIVGIALTALAGCGIGQGLYRHGYNGRNYRNNADYYRGDYGYTGNPSAAPEYSPDNRGYNSMTGYGTGRSGYCR